MSRHCGAILYSILALFSSTFSVSVTNEQSQHSCHRLFLLHDGCQAGSLEPHGHEAPYASARVTRVYSLALDSLRRATNRTMLCVRIHHLQLLGLRCYKRASLGPGMAARLAPAHVVGPPRSQNEPSSEEGTSRPGSLDRLETKVDIKLLEATVHRAPTAADVNQPLLGRSRGAGATIGIGGGTFPMRQQRLDLEQAAASTPIEPTLSPLQWLGLGSRLLVKAMALGVYAILLLPGHLQVMWYYFSSKSILRNISYGQQRRNLLDFYVPKSSTSPRPVVIFVAGGAWMIGNKAWGALFAKRLAERDILVASVDYRNFPKATISQMVEDVSQAISFVLRNAHNYGGDASRVFLVGQSAGAHLAACALVRQAERGAAAAAGAGAGGVSPPDWQASQFAAFIGISGLYDLTVLVDHFQSRGLHQALLWRLMEGEVSLPLFSPECTIAMPEFQPALCFLPPVHLFHGAADFSVPPQSSSSFATVLRSLACQVTITVYPEKTHTDMIVQDWMRGGKDALQDDLLAIVQPGEAESVVDARLVPEFLIQLARRVSPF